MANFTHSENIERNTEANGDNCTPEATAKDVVKVKDKATLYNAQNSTSVEYVNSAYHSSYTVVSKEKADYTKIFNSTDWMVGVLLFSLVILLTTKIAFGKQFSETMRSIFDFRLAQKNIRRNNKQKQAVSLLVNFIFLLNFSLFSVQVLNYFHIKIFPTSLFLNFVLFFVGTLLVSVLRKGVMSFFGFILKKRNSFFEYTQNITLFNKGVGVALFPFIIAVPFIIKNLQFAAVIVAITVLAIIYMLRIFRGIQIIVKKQVSIFYSILYLCTLEVIPALLLYRTIVVLVDSDIAVSIVSLL